jgi:hypothetical protein
VPLCEAQALVAQAEEYGHAFCDDNDGEEDEGLGCLLTAVEQENLTEDVLIPQVRPAHKYPNSHWEIIHPPGETMQYVYNLKRFTRLSVTSHSQPLINAKYQIPSNKLLANNILNNN